MAATASLNAAMVSNGFFSARDPEKRAWKRVGTVLASATTRKALVRLWTANTGDDGAELLDRLPDRFGAGR